VTESPAPLSSLMNRLAVKRSGILSATRLLVAALLLCGLFFSVVPFQTVLASPACRLACCAKRAPHSAGSCADGSCHASLRRKRRALNHNRTSNTTSELCGLAFKSAVENKTRPRINLASTTIAPAEAAATFGRPCPPECSGTVANSNSQRNSATISVSSDAGPAALQRTSFHSTHAQLSDVTCRECAPRGPPLPLS
jgi:hypothetical protein